MYETYIPGFTNELWGGSPETMSVDGGLTGSYQSLPTAQPVQAEPYTENYQSFPTAQPVQMAPYSDGTEGLRPADIRAQLGDEMTITPRQMAAAPMANNGEVSPFTSNPYMVVNYGKEVNDPSFANTQNLDPTQTYRLVDQRTGQVITSDPNDPTSLARLVLAANQLSGNSATKANWDIYSGDTSIASDRPNYTGGVLGALLQYGLPIGLSFIPGVGWAGSAALAGAGSTAGKLISGYDLGDALKSGALTAATAGLMKAPILSGGNSISGAISNALGIAPTTPGAANVGDLQAAAIDTADALTALGVNPAIAGQIASGPLSAIGSAAGSAAGSAGGIGGSIAGTDALGNFITVPGKAIASNIPSSFLNGALGAASGALSGTNYGDQVFNQPSPQDQTLEQQFDDVFKAPTTVYGGVGSNAGAIGSPGVSVPVSSTPAVTNPETVVTGAREPVQNGGALPTDIVVTATPNGPKLPDGKPSELDTVLAPYTNLSGNIPEAPTTPQTTDPKKGLSTLDYIQLASLGIGALGDLFGGNKNAPGAKISGGMGGLNPVFGAQLPGANLPGLTGSVGGTRPATQSGLNTTQDWYRYGYGPEQSFYNYVPMGQPNTSQAYTGYAEGGSTGYGEGGGLGQYVEGPGDGRDDQIPSMLSDGEYVFDAETVALLGNGSNKAGADRLDEFRVNIRKHKGREMSRGEFSKDAKRPEQYLAGGRA